MDFQQLISYTHELQVQNKQLKKHIFNIQQQLNQKSQAIALIIQKKEELNEHIKKCENEIIKRQQRQLALISNVDALSKQIQIYTDELTHLKQTINILRQQGETNKINAKSMKLPPNPKVLQKCRNCELLAMDKQGLFIELQKQKQKSYMLLRDVECMVGTFCAQ